MASVSFMRSWIRLPGSLCFSISLCSITLKSIKTLISSAGKSSEEENKSRVADIHNLKEKLKSENEELKKIKYKLKDVQEKQRAEKEVSSVVEVLWGEHLM